MAFQGAKVFKKQTSSIKVGAINSEQMLIMDHERNRVLLCSREGK